MIRFFVRLVIAALADWFTWQISTPEMRFERKARRSRRAIREAFAATEPMAAELFQSFSIMARSMAVYLREVK